MNPPLVHSISYGALEESVSSAYADAFNIEAIKLGKCLSSSSATYTLKQWNLFTPLPPLSLFGGKRMSRGHHCCCIW